MKLTYTRNQFNENTYDLTVEVDRLPEVPMTVLEETDDSHFWYGEDEYGFVKFGISHKYPTMGHEAGYMWSSRASVFNGLFDKCCKEVTVKVRGERWGYHGFAMNIYALCELLHEDYELAIYNDFKGEVWLEVLDVYQSPDYLEGRGELIDTICKKF